MSEDSTTPDLADRLPRLIEAVARGDLDAQSAGSGHSSGHARYRVAQVSTWTDGLIVRITGYPSTDIDEARAAAARLARERG